MKPAYKALIYIFLIIGSICHAQPHKPTSSEIYHKLKKLNFLGSVLYIAAHPDDENTRLISYLSNDVHARTGYLALTRGDGGQNLIGNELRELLGVIRTQELIEARKIDGGEQFFSRANDFGYSKLPDETLKIWNKDEVLQDMVWVIRTFKPDVVITRFDHRTPGSTHGHHTSSAMLTQEAYTLANDPDYERSQLQYTSVWQPQRVFFNLSWWFFGGKENFEKADKSKYIHLSTGTYYPLLGESNQEIAALSRSRHKSQGFGVTGERGDDMEYLELIKGNDLKDRENIFDGINTSWSRVKGGTAIGLAIDKITEQFDLANPAASVTALAAVYKQIQALDDEYWKEVKTNEITDIIANCAGLYIEAVAEQQSATPGSNINIKCEAINRSNIPMKLVTLQLNPGNKAVDKNIDLKNNVGYYETFAAQLPQNLNYTSPYWLTKEGTSGMYKVSDQQKIGIADIIRQLKVNFQVNISGINIPFERTVAYKYNDPVQGETYQPFDIIPAVTTQILNKVELFTDDKTRLINVKIKSGINNCTGKLKLDLPKSWTISPEYIDFDLPTKGSESIVTFEVTPPPAPQEATAKSLAYIDGKEYDREQEIIAYPHIASQQVLLPSIAKFAKVDLKIKGQKIAYIMGAGDNVPQSLQQMGYEVSLLVPESISAETLKAFDAVVMGIRAYNVLDGLAYKQQILLNYVYNGGTMLVQYNTTGMLSVKDVGPYPLRISRDRVTDEDAKIKFINPDSPLLNYPNKITENDFKGWVQEQGLYYPDEWDKHYEPVLSSADSGEKAKKGSLLVAHYGKGYYIYTGLSFFRELPAGVSGAYRLMANLIAVGK
ncbi:PIG-L family deacetylase [Flavobacterium rhizosphaerae]|uniref:PIG-L family deacetylase n=1 Tax=Flavobacterium rhizosphaerae TaxID=3163298 RepID=A0ABW8YV43_9FLAO